MTSRACAPSCVRQLALPGAFPLPGSRGLASVWVGDCARDAARRASLCFFRMTTSGALFPSLVPGSRGSSTKYLVEFRAGKMSLKGTTVTPDKRKGLVYIQQTDDSLIHFCWKDRTSGTVEDVSACSHSRPAEALSKSWGCGAIGVGVVCPEVCRLLFEAMYPTVTMASKILAETAC